MTDIFDDIPVRDDLQTIAFYNLENLFDIHKDRNTHDSDFLPTSVKRWTPKRYDNKLRKLSYAISNIGKRETGKNPAIVGLAEVENATVIQDLLNYKHLENYNYGFVHYDSPDERGIDVALIYDKANFEVLHSETYSVLLRDDDGSPDYTRDILLVSGKLDEENVHVIVTHWSSRREGQKETEFKRMVSSNKVVEIIAKLKQENEDAKIIVMGDFNDEPDNKSIKNLVDNCGLYNPMETLRSFSRGTTYHHRKWNLFDQIMFTTNYFKNSNNEFEFFKANIFDEDFLKTFSGRYKGSPFRTYVGKKYNGGYSDHFPVYTVFKK
ncbi:endonuclease/exonuclease/phosphatase family protein [Neotamlana laminarinivorans]|uniref:Endonuclease n=1 Tax=Neotamlana laminarinivorans TaxID=2883124 RepID=A0A9X1HZM0_9FLAO|nr:endonuclease [Tamlana laminarinivorans]MCB4799084.1 endonuclease [Tamlana laminarinivorans]